MLIDRAEQILATFMQRDFSLRSIGMKDHHILEEIERLRQCCCVDDYKRVSRVGSTLQLSRKGRMHIWSLRENAKKHASIENEMKQVGVL
jgi:hypothetical protein